MTVKPFAIGCEVVIDHKTNSLLQVVLYIQVKDERDRRINWTHVYTPSMIAELDTNEKYKSGEQRFIWKFFLLGLVELEKKEKNYVSDDNIEEISEVIVPEIPEVIEHVIKMENYNKTLSTDL